MHSSHTHDYCVICGEIHHACDSPTCRTCTRLTPPALDDLVEYAAQVRHLARTHARHERGQDSGLHSLELAVRYLESVTAAQCDQITDLQHEVADLRRQLETTTLDARSRTHADR